MAALLLAVAVPCVACAQLAGRSVERLPELASILDTTGFRGTVLVYDLQRDRLQSTHRKRVDARRIPASTFKIANALIATEMRLVPDEHTVMPWDSIVRPRTELNRDLDLATAFRISAVPHFQALALAIGPQRMAH